jgi:hypothetical protein
MGEAVVQVAIQLPLQQAEVEEAGVDMMKRGLMQKN